MRVSRMYPGEAVAMAVAAVAVAMLLSIDFGVIGVRAASPSVPARAAAPLVSALDVSFETADSGATTLAATAGRVRIASLFYAHCAGLCPLTLASLKQLENGLTPRERARLGVVLLSLDPATDTPEALRAFRTRQGIDRARWLLGRPAAADLPRLAAAFGIRYRQLTDGSTDHQPALLLLDRDNRLLARTTQVGRPDARFNAALRDALGEAAH